MPLPLPVLIVDDNERDAKRFNRLLTGAGVDGEAIDFAGDVAQAMRCLDRRRYALALVDMYLPDGTGSQVIRRMSQSQPALQAIVVSTFGTDDLLLDALRAGAVGYVVKDADDDEIVLSLACIERGGAAMSPGIARRLLQLAATLPPAAAPALPASAPPGSPSVSPTIAPPKEPVAIELSPRERDVLELIAVGCTNKDVANKLGLSVHTVDFYAKRLYTKLSAKSRTQAVNLARASGLLE